MDLESEDQQHTLADTVESSQAMNLDQGTGEGTANGGGGGAASTGDQVGADLDPLALLYLTRVNKSLRRLFTSKRDTQRIWKMAFQNVGFPALKADDWDLVALANLLDQVPRCVACGKQGPTTEVDIATRISVHPHCRSRVYSNSAKLEEQIANLHLSAISCAPSISFKVGRRQEDRFVTKQVISINSQLHSLGSAISSSRGPAKADARKALEKFTTGKRHNVDVRFDDETRILDWKEKYPRVLRVQAEKRRQEVENARIGRRFDEIRDRLVTLGYQIADIEALTFDQNVRKQDPLTDQEWNSISSAVFKSLERAKKKRFARQRDAILRQLYHDLKNKAVSSNERSAFLPEDVFLKLDIPGIVGISRLNGPPSKAELQLALPTIEDQVAKFCRSLKLAYARRLVESLVSAGHPPSQAFLDALNPPDFSPTTIQSGEVSLDALRLNDPSTLANNELDELLGRFTSRAFWFCDHNGPHELAPFPQINAIRRGPTTHGCGSGGGRVGKYWLQILFSLLKSTGIDDGPRAVVDQKFNALGPSFVCRWGGDNGGAHPHRLKWPELLSHVCSSSHARALNPYYGEGRFKVNDIVFAPLSANAAASTSSQQG